MIDTAKTDLSAPALDGRRRQRLRRRLLNWFAAHRRDLPWRRDRDPYRIWVSEIMLQQTQVATVIPYFERFVEAFPHLQDLAAADEQEVLKLWEGLGYYRRARDLHRTARLLHTHHGGDLPDDPEVWRQLPGVGRYVMGAVLSQAFERRLPIVEANSLRVLCRLFGQTTDPRKGPGQKWLWETAASLLPARQIGDFNQALMELGALVCTPVAPRCAACPLRRDCVAYQKGLQEQIPPRPVAPAPVFVPEVAIVVRRGPRVLLVQRPASGRWANMWEFPRGLVGAGEDHYSAAARLLPALTGIRAVIGSELLTIRHGVTHHRITLVCLEAAYRAGRFVSEFYAQGAWLQPAQLQAYPVSAPQRRLARVLAGDARQRQLF